jgi:hypothetical protein
LKKPEWLNRLLLSQAPGGRGARASHVDLLLEAQRTYGNRHVQRLVASAEPREAQGERAAPMHGGPIGSLANRQSQGAAVCPDGSKSLLVQRDKIDHQTLSWSDFQGKVPKGATFDAATWSDFADPKLASLIPTTLTAVDTGEDCTAGRKPATKFKVDITIDPTTIAVKSFMWQEKSWHQDWLTDEAARRKKCLAEDSPSCEKGFDKQFDDVKKQRSTAEADCRKSFDDAATNINTQCKQAEGDCKKAFASGSTSFNFSAGSLSITATTAKECTTVLLPGCKTALMATQSFSQSVDGNTATATKRSECGKPFGADLEKLLRGAVTVEMSRGGASTTVTNRGDCRKDAFLDPCAKTLMEAGSNKVLEHEQNHFDLTDALAAKAQKELQDLVGTFKTEVVACGQAAAEALAKSTLASELKKLQGKFAAAKEELSKLQDKYDAETRHGVVEEKQAEWETRISKGFMSP